jgi:hypothetical protein
MVIIRIVAQVVQIILLFQLDAQGGQDMASSMKIDLRAVFYDAITGYTHSLLTDWVTLMLKSFKG